MRLTLFDRKKLKKLGAGADVEDERAYPIVKTTWWWKDPGLLRLNLQLIWPMFSQFVEGYDGSLTNNLQALNVWEQFFDHPQGSTLGLINSIFFVGSMIAPFFMPYVSDKFGRRMCIQLGCVLSILGAALLTGANGRSMYITGRFFLGMGNTFISIGPVLVAELAYPHHRSVCTALSNAGYSAGSIIAAWVCFGTLNINNNWAWRIPALIQIPFSVVQMIGLYFMPESPRWYVATDQPEKALDILVKYHGNGDRNDPVVDIEFEEIVQTLALEKTSNNVSLKSVFRTRGNWWRLFCLTWAGMCYQLSGNGLVSYYLNSMLTTAGITSQTIKVLISATSQIFSFICSVVFSFLPGKVGRRRLILISLALMWIDFAVLTATVAVFNHNGSKSASYANIAFIYLYSGVHNLGFVGAIMVFLTEILPYNLRSTGISYFGFIKSASSTINTYVNPVGMAAIGWKYYFVYVGWIAVEWVVVYVTFPETKGLALEEVAIIFDGEDAVVTAHQQREALEKVADEEFIERA
ncbi:hexose transporter Hxt13p [Trichomonascus vanleenenianus]|uniref:hexose transporter Hxt13p n=1 Tax=Trichomonascus vanleenenianus TaxID=2268995 RepID=UPI003ECA94C6